MVVVVKPADAAAMFTVEDLKFCGDHMFGANLEVNMAPLVQRLRLHSIS